MWKGDKHMKVTLKKFVDEICSTCKGECHKGITFIIGEEKKVRCVDYIKDESKIVKTERNKITTAKREKPIMSNLV